MNYNFLNFPDKILYINIKKLSLIYKKNNG